MSGYKLKLKSKRLKSGNCQIQFFISSGDMQTHYGYLLATADTTLKEVVGRIESKVKNDARGRTNDNHLFNLKDRHRNNENILLFNNR